MNTKNTCYQKNKEILLKKAEGSYHRKDGKEQKNY